MPLRQNFSNIHVTDTGKNISDSLNTLNVMFSKIDAQNRSEKELATTRAIQAGRYAAQDARQVAQDKRQVGLDAERVRRNKIKDARAKIEATHKDTLYGMQMDNAKKIKAQNNFNLIEPDLTKDATVSYKFTGTGYDIGGIGLTKVDDSDEASFGIAHKGALTDEGSAYGRTLKNASNLKQMKEATHLNNKNEEVRTFSNKEAKKIADELNPDKLNRNEAEAKNLIDKSRIIINKYKDAKAKVLSGGGINLSVLGGKTKTSKTQFENKADFTSAARKPIMDEVYKYAKDKKLTLSNEEIVKINSVIKAGVDSNTPIGTIAAKVMAGLKQGKDAWGPSNNSGKLIFNGDATFNTPPNERVSYGGKTSTNIKSYLTQLDKEIALERTKINTLTPILEGGIETGKMEDLTTKRPDKIEALIKKIDSSKSNTGIQKYWKELSLIAEKPKKELVKGEVAPDSFQVVQSEQQKLRAIIDKKLAKDFTDGKLSPWDNTLRKLGQHPEQTAIEEDEDTKLALEFQKKAIHKKVRVNSLKNNTKFVEEFERKRESAKRSGGYIGTSMLPEGFESLTDYIETFKKDELSKPLTQKEIERSITLFNNSPQIR